ncbi:MAG: 16S rRNA (adenine(1518)-N(6)/adenine(1519)-N(6))-dimethyltransferase RsmA [Nitrososphaerota archaeon]|jgi:16S rRNA (adenine1518-N6/adenine1519-N6)-dimethyltransferase|nr:16S rRNA (adenine(1518)-N(6)/adenine(1519)-N(6))-dimethyltransferase RsmA [Nitrososphaerota archaeon]
MSLEEIQQLLQTFQITPTKLLGQNFMIEPAFYPKLASYAELVSSDVVLDAGAGFGFLSTFLADKCQSIVAVEKDPQITLALRQQTKSLDNITVVEGDILKTGLPTFNKTIAAPPYYLSSKLVLFLLEHNIDCAILIVQKEFADRLTAKVGSENYSWLTVTVYQKAHVEILDFVPKDMFYPQPDVDSVIVRIKPWHFPPFTVKDRLFFERMVKWLFTERNKKILNALEPFIRTEVNMEKQVVQKIIQTFPCHGMRPREITPENFGAIANAFTN